MIYDYPEYETLRAYLAALDRAAADLAKPARHHWWELL